MARDSIVIIGAGIIGLDVALELSKRGYGSQVTVVSDHAPGDQSVNYTSPWAGANFSAISGSNENALKWDRGGYLAMWKQVEAEAKEAKYIAKTPSTEYFDIEPPAEKIQSMKEYLKDLRILPTTELPTGVAYGIKFTTLTINSPAHILHLQRLLSSSEYGNIPFLHRRLHSLDEAFLSRNTKIVFNCTGNGATKLAGVNDKQTYPTRGQVVIVKATKVKENIMRHGKDYETYVIPRPLSGGNVILGGFMQKGNASGDTYKVESESILKRTKELLPIMGDADVEVLAVASGLRPSREGGARVEAETYDQKTIIHNYGAGGTGFQAGVGMAIDAVELAGDILETLRPCSVL